MAVALALDNPLLSNWRGPAYTLTNELYVPSAMFAKGRGFIRPPVDEVPELREFLYPASGDAAWNPESIPETFSQTNWDTYERYHRYLIYSMGIVWWIFGVSWGSAKVLALGLYIASALQVYVLLKMLMNRAFALPGALLFVVAPAVKMTVFNIRDFSKAPFLIALITVLVYLLLEKRRPRQYLGAAVLAGCIVGIGLGFRRDLLIAFPPILLVLALCPLDIKQGGLRWRAGAIMGTAMAATLCAVPILGTFQERGSLVAHDIMMGLATTSDEFLALESASYERVPVKHDTYVSGLASGFLRREFIGDNVRLQNSHLTATDEAKSLYVRETLRLFPADMLLRGYAAFLRVSYGINYESGKYWPDEIIKHGLFYVLLSLLLISLYSARLAVMLLIVMLYFCGVTSLQFESRHSFHLIFIPVGCLLFPLYTMWHFLVRIYSACSRNGSGLASVFPTSSDARRAAMGGLQFSAMLVLLTFVPWRIATFVQSSEVREVREALSSATKAPVETERIQYGDWVYFRPTAALESVVPVPSFEHSFFKSHYLMAEFDSYPGRSPMYWLVATEDGRQDYSAYVKATPTNDSTGIRTQYFIDMPEHSSEVFNIWFDAVGVPVAFEESFRGLYLVTTPQRIGTNCAFSLADTPEYIRHYQTLPLMPPVRTTNFEPETSHLVIRDRAREIHRLIAEGELAQARAKLADVLDSGLLQPELCLALAKVYELEGNLDASAEVMLKLLAERPEDRGIAYRYEALARKELDTTKALALWERAAEVAPENIVVESRLKFAREKSELAPPAS